VHEFKARYVLLGNTVEFYYPMRLALATLDGLVAFDNEPYGRKVQFFIAAAVDALSSNGVLTESAATLWADWRSDRESCLTAAYPSQPVAV